MNVLEGVKSFLREPFNKYLVAALLALGLLVYFLGVGGVQSKEKIVSDGGAAAGVVMHFFYLPTCPHCNAQERELNPLLETDYGVRIIRHDASAEGRELFQKVCAEKSLKGYVPTTLVGDKIFVGYSSGIGEEIKAVVKDCVEKKCVDPLLSNESCPPSTQNNTSSLEVELPFLGSVNAANYSLPALAVMLGLVDGFNPCAMWVLVYLIALVASLNDRKRIWLIVGSFVLASGILYFLFMTAWLNAFLLLGYMRVVTLFVGLLALGGGVLSLKDYWESRNQALVCKVEGAEEKKETMDKIQGLVAAPLTWATIVGVIALAFVVNSVEFVCSAAIPAVFTQVLALSNLSFWEHYGYIALYDFFFMFDDLIIFGLAAFALSGSVGEKYAKYCKVIGGAILVSLGLMLLFSPNLLA